MTKKTSASKGSHASRAKQARAKAVAARAKKEEAKAALSEKGSKKSTASKSKKRATKKTSLKSAPQNSKANLKRGSKKSIAATYVGNFLIVTILILVVRVFSVLLFSIMLGMEWEIQSFTAGLPVFGFSERNVRLLEWMNSISQLATTIVVFFGFLLVFHRKAQKTHSENYLRVLFIWLLGVIATGVQYGFSLALEIYSPIHFHTNAELAIVVMLFVFIAIEFYRAKKYQIGVNLKGEKEA